jgi:peptide-methionine (S)-S-oxide reductase
VQLRYTSVIRNLALALIVTFTLLPPLSSKAAQTERVVLAGGCFWGMQGVFERLKGVTDTVVGYSGGSKGTAEYETVSTGTTGHAESIEITFDPAKISFGQILAVYFLVAHDPTELNRQGPDEGTQYRSVIFYTTQAQHDEAQAMISLLTEKKTYRSPIVTQLVPLRAFYPAEAYHQHFMDNNPDNPYIVYNDAPKVEALRKKFASLVKS